MLQAWNKLHTITFVLSLLYSYNGYSAHLSDTIKAEEAGHIMEASPNEPINLIRPPEAIKNTQNSQNQPMLSTNGKITPNRAHPQVAKLYEGLGEKIKHHRMESMKKNPTSDKSGMDLALKELASDFEAQFFAIMWQFASNVDTGQGFAKDVMESELRTNLIIEGHQMGPIGQDVYEELKTLAEQNGEELNGPRNG